MRLIYVDESGNTGTKLDDPAQPLLVLTALILPPEKVRQVEDAVRDVGEKYFGPQARNTDFEFHGAEIYQRKGRYFGKIDQTKSFQILDDLVELACSIPELNIGYVAIDKKRYYGTRHIQQAAFGLLIERVEQHLQNVSAHGLLICDENQDLEQLLIDDLDRYKKIGTDFGYNRVAIEKLVDSVHFVKSNNNNLMQLCDVLCYAIYRGKLAQDSLLSAFHKADVGKDNSDSFIDWLDSEAAHKGHRYFYKKKQRLDFIFSKDFPQ